MTFDALISEVCDTVGKSDDVFRDFVRRAARRWHTTIWNIGDWKDSKMLAVTQARGGTLVAPWEMEKIIALRSDTVTYLPARDLQTWLQIDANIFDRTGTPVGFSLLPAMATGTTPNGEKLKFTTNDAGDAGKTVVIRGQLAGSPLRENLVLSAGTVQTVNEYDWMQAITKPVTEAKVIMTSATTNTPLGEIASFETSRLYQRIMILEQLAEQTNSLLLLGKMRAPEIIDDGDSTALPGMDQALIAFTLSSAWKRERQYSKAQVEEGAGTTHVATMRQQEDGQAARQIRIIPFVDGNLDGWQVVTKSNPLGQ